LLKVVNDHLLKDLTELGLWNPDMKNRLMYENGSIQVYSFIFEKFPFTFFFDIEY